MKILHITSGDDRYGSALALYELLEREIDSGITPVVLSPRRNGMTEYCEKKGIKYYYFFYEWSQIPKHNNMPVFMLKYVLRLISYHVNNQRAERKIEQIIVDERIDIVHTNNMVVDIGLKATNKLRIPHVWHLRELLKENYNCRPIRRDYIRKLNESGGSFIAVSEFVADIWRREGLAGDRIKVIYDGVDADKFCDRILDNRVNSDGLDNAKFSNIKSDAKFIGERTDDVGQNIIKFVMCGSFCEAKNQKLLVEAIKHLDEDERKKIKVSFFGKRQGGYYAETERMVGEYHLNDCISFEGYSDNISEALSHYDCGIMCSQNEAFGRVTVEYMMAGLLTIVTDAGANREITVNGRYAILYERGSAEALAEVMRNLIRDNLLMNSRRVDCIEYARREYDINKNVNELIMHFKTLIK